MSWINKILPSGISKAEGDRRASVPEGVWTKCIKCEAVLYRPDLERNAQVCPKCDHHMRIGARKRIDLFLDKEDREEVFSDIEPIDRLKFRDKKKYSVRLAAAQKSTGERDALVAMRGALHGMPVIVVAFEFNFHGGSMGHAVGEKFSRAAQLALAERVPLVCFAASGGARMQEALISLMQMAKTSAVIERMHSEGVPYVSVLTDPIYGGVSASLALLGDLNIAEPDARAGFAGPNIIEQTIRQKLPKGFQRSEFLLEHGAIDMIVHRGEMRDTIARLLAKLSDLEAVAALATSTDDDEGAPLASAGAVQGEAGSEATAVDEDLSGADDGAGDQAADERAVDLGAAEADGKEPAPTAADADGVSVEGEAESTPVPEAASLESSGAEPEESATVEEGADSDDNEGEPASDGTPEEDKKPDG